MPSKIITITKPILISPDMFIVSYRKVGDTVFTLHGNEDNDPFTLTVPTDGQYEIMVEQDDCPAFIYGLVDITTDPPCDCATVDTPNVEIVNIDAVTTVLRIPFAGALPTSPCGWRLTYRNLKKGVTNILTFPTLTNPLDRVIDRYCDYSYTLEVNCCNEQFTYCAQGQVDAEDEIPQCQKIILKDEGTPGGHLASFAAGVGFYFDILFRQSIPATLPAVAVVYVQLIGGGGATGGTPDSGAQLLTPVPSGDPTYPWKIRVVVNPNLFLSSLVYILLVKDTACGGPDILWK